jgi:hypothetical protein
MVVDLMGVVCSGFLNAQTVKRAWRLRKHIVFVVVIAEMRDRRS